MTDPQDLFERIWYGQRDGRVDFGIDLKLLNKPGSPVFSRSDNLLPWVALICLGIVGWRLGNWVGAAAAVASMLIMIATTINFAVMRRLRQRSVEYALSGKSGFEDLWSHGALSILLRGEPESEMRGPGGDWQTFAEARLPKTAAERGR